MFENGRSGGAGKDRVTNPRREIYTNSYGTTSGRGVVNAQVHHGEDQDGLVTAPPTICDDGTNKGHSVDPESVEGTDGKRFLLAHAKSTGNSIGAMLLWNGTGSRARR